MDRELDKHTSSRENICELEGAFYSDESQASEQVELPLVLVIDDNPALCDMLYQALTLAGYSAKAYTNREAWIASIGQSEKLPALILLDLSLPLKREGSFLQRVRMQWKNAPPIIVMTTSKQVYRELTGAERVILKPFHVSHLLTEIEKMLA